MVSIPVAACGPPRRLQWRSDRLRGWNRALRGVLLAGALALCGVIVNRSDAALHRAQVAALDSPEFIYLPSSAFLRDVSLGYEHLLADVLWFRTISYFGQHYRGDHVYKWLAYMCNLVTDLDPRAQHVYLFGGVILPWEADRVDDGIALLEKGTRNLPDSWRLHYILGFNYYFFKNDLAAASRALGAAVRLPDTPEFVSQMFVTLFAAHAGPETALTFLQGMERDGLSEEMRGTIHQRVLEMQLTGDIDALEGAAKDFESRWQRPPVDLAELVSQGVLAAIPPEPFGGRYLLGEDGRVVSSSGHEPRRLRHSNFRDEVLSAQAHRGAP